MEFFALVVMGMVVAIPFVIVKSITYNYIGKKLNLSKSDEDEEWRKDPRFR